MRICGISKGITNIAAIVQRIVVLHSRVVMHKTDVFLYRLHPIEANA